MSTATTTVAIRREQELLGQTVVQSAAALALGSKWPDEHALRGPG
jgi:hypothetical protein